MKRPDIDIDVADRARALDGVEHTPASLLQGLELRRHNTGLYFQRIPVDPITRLSAFPSNAGDVAGQLGYFKFDVLPAHVYRLVRDPDHMDALAAQEPDWGLMVRSEVCSRLFHLGNSVDVVQAYEPRSMADLACLLAAIRPAKRHLLGQSWERIRAEVWLPGADGEYHFKKSHAMGYALAVMVQLNSMVEAGEVVV